MIITIERKRREYNFLLDNRLIYGYVQINGVDFLYNENKVLICNSDLNLNIICSLVFALECKFENPTDIRLNIIFAEKQVFDANWQPK